MPKGMVDKLYRLIAGEEWPEMERAITHLSAEMPAEVASMKDRRIRPMNGMERGLNRMMRPGVAASTTPFGNITYDRKMIEDAMLRPEDVLAHELTHVKQMDRDGGPFWSLAKTITNAATPYGQRDFEKEALDVEMRRMGRRKRTGDIPLPDDEFYDYAAAQKAGAKPDASGHWPSEFKKPGHPNEIVGGFNTRTGERVLSQPRASESELIRLGWDPDTAKRLLAMSRER